MGANSSIEWTDHTFNPWRGCTKVSPGCAHCYAETLSHRNPKVLGIWGKDGTRQIAAPQYWLEPIRWNEAARLAHERHRVFCASLADVFEGAETMPAASCMAIRKARLQLFALIVNTPFLDWLLLTKRPHNVLPLIEQAALDCPSNGPTCEMLNAWLRGTPPENVWVGTSVEDQVRADERIPELLNIPARVRFLSMEPLLGAVDLRNVRMVCGDLINALTGEICDAVSGCLVHQRYEPIDWAIVGGESGPNARPMDPAWARSLRDQCRAAAVAFHFKQWGGDTFAAKKAAGRQLDGRTWDELPT